MVLSLRGESMKLDPIIAFWDKVAERFSESMTKWVDQFIEGMKQPQPKSDTKHDRKVLICGYTQEEDCVCEATEIVESEYDVDDTIMDLKEDEMNSWTRNGETTGDENGDPIVTEISDYNDLLKKTEVPSPPNHPVCDPFTHSKFLLEINFLCLGSADSTARGMFCANKKELIIANEVFDKNPQKRGYMEVLNPEPPDDYGPIIQGTIVTTCVQTVIAEMGESWFNCQKLFLPKNCRYEFQMKYGSIRWSVGATFGYAQAAKYKRVIAFIGDRSFQETAQDISTMILCRQCTIIFLINNGVNCCLRHHDELNSYHQKPVVTTVANNQNGHHVMHYCLTHLYNKYDILLLDNIAYNGSVEHIFFSGEPEAFMMKLLFENGIPVTLSVIGTQRFTFQDNVYDLLYCARCRGHWDDDGGKPLMELNWVLRFGGFFIGFATPVYRTDAKYRNVWHPMVALTESICWKVVAKSFPSTGIGIFIYQKLVSYSCYERHNDNVLLLCKPVWAIQIRKFARISPRSTMVRLARGMLKLYECYMLDQLKCMDGCHLYVPWNSASLVAMRNGHTKVVWHLYNNIMECCVVWFIQNSIVWMVLQSHWNYWDNLMGLGMKAICTKEVLIDDQRKSGPPRKVKWWYSTFYTVKVLVGAGFLSLSYVMAYLRWGPGTEFMIILSWCNTLYIMGQRIQLHECVYAVHFDCYHNSSQYTCGEQVILQISNFSDGGNKVFVTMSFGCNICVLNLFLEFYGGVGSNVENTKAQAHTDYDIGITRTDSNHKLVAYTKGAQGDEIFIAHTINKEADTTIGKLLVGVTYGLVDNISARSIIMQNVSQRSVVVMDELGRATSFDGFAIAWSCCVKILHFYGDEKNNHMGFNFQLKDGLRHVPHYGLLLAGVVGLSGSVIDIARSITSKITAKEMKRLEVNFEQYHGNDFHGFKLSSKLLVFPP